MSLALIFAIDAIWIRWVGGAFYAGQLESIARFDAQGGFDVRMGPAIMVYLLMALAIEVFVFSNRNLQTLKQHALHGGLLGFVIYGVYDGTNRATLTDYPFEMMVVDMMWGTALFTVVSLINFQLRHRISFL
jgi:uncharacterized membrane protein